MKKTFKMLVLLVAAATLTFTACQKDDPTPDNNSTNPPSGGGEQTTNIMANTSWESHMENVLSYSGVAMNVTFDASLDFFDEINGEFFQYVNVDVPDFPALSQQIDETLPYTYVYYGDSCVLNFKYFDEEENDTVSFSSTLIYDKTEQTLTMDFDDDDMAQVLGTDIVVFHKRNTGSK